MIIYIALSTAMGLSGFLIYLYFYKKGQFDEVEDIKYEMFRNDEEKN